MKTIDLRSDVITSAKGCEGFRTCRSITARLRPTWSLSISPSGMPKPSPRFLKERNILVSGGQRLRQVTHLDIERPGIDTVIQAFTQYFAGCR